MIYVATGPSTQRDSTLRSAPYVNASWAAQLSRCVSGKNQGYYYTFNGLGQFQPATQDMGDADTKNK